MSERCPVAYRRREDSSGNKRHVLRPPHRVETGAALFGEPWPALAVNRCRRDRSRPPRPGRAECRRRAGPARAAEPDGRVRRPARSPGDRDRRRREGDGRRPDRDRQPGPRNDRIDAARLGLGRRRRCRCWSPGAAGSTASSWPEMARRAPRARPISCTPGLSSLALRCGW